MSKGVEASMTAKSLENMMHKEEYFTIISFPTALTLSSDRDVYALALRDNTADTLYCKVSLLNNTLKPVYDVNLVADTINVNKRSEEHASKLYNLLLPHEEKYEMCFRVDKDKSPTLYKALEAARNEAWDVARELTVQALKENPNDPEGYYMMAALYRVDSRFDKAEEMLNKAIKLNPFEKKYYDGLDANEMMRKNEIEVVSQLQGT